MIEKERVRLILIDVVVEDSQENHINGLTKDDFSLFIDGKEKFIATFDEHCKTVPFQKYGVNKDQIDVVEKADPRHIIFYFDGAHLSIGGRNESIKAAEKFLLDIMNKNDNVMIATFVKRPHVLQYFTNDKLKLMEALQTIKDNAEFIDDYGISEGIRIKNLRSKAEAIGYAYENYNYTLEALEGLQSIFVLLEPIKGKKAFVYFSDTLRDVPGLFYIACVSDRLELMSYKSRLSIEPQFRKLINDANFSRISFYAVDAFGLTAPGDRWYEDSVFNALSTLSFDTGGKVLKGSNDLSRYIPAMMEDFNCYYTLGFRPEKEADGKQHSLKVTINAPHLKVRSKTGFTDFTEEDKKSHELLSALFLPHLFQDLEVISEIFPLKPIKGSWESIIQVALNLEEIKLLKYPLKEMYLLCTLYGSNKIIKEINQHIKLALNMNELNNAPDWIIHQEKYRLKPGNYTLVAVMKDISTELIGAFESQISIPEVSKNTLMIGSTLVSGSLPVEMHLQDKKKSEQVDNSQFLIRPNNQFSVLETITIATPICSTWKDLNKGYRESTIKRRILKDDQLFMEFEVISLDDPPDSSSGCYNIVDIIESSVLETGVYAYEIKLQGEDFDQKTMTKFSIRGNQ